MARTSRRVAGQAGREMHSRSKTARSVAGAVVAVLVLSWAVSASAQRLRVKIINHRDNQTDYSFIVPGHWYSNAYTNVNCNGGDESVNCGGETSASGTVTPAHEISFTVYGATLALLLPDGRVAVVNCKSKFRERFAGPAGNHRSCRVPINDNIEARFKGDKAKLIWPVSLDGKKKASETYKILGIFAKAKEK